MLATMDAATVTTTTHNSHARQFEIHDGERLIGKAEYTLASPRDSARIFFHTEVEEAYSGQGLAGLLVGTALDETVASGRRIVPVCPYVAAYVGKHPEYAPHVDQPTKEHLDAVRALGGGA